MEADVFLLPETKLATDQPWVQAQLHACSRKSFGRKCKLATSASPIQFATQYKPGGVMGLVTGDCVGRVLKMGSDQLGRWVYFKLHGGSGCIITIISTYQVCQQNVKTAGPLTATTQQFSMLHQTNRHQPHRVRHHHATDLVGFVKQCQDQGEKVIVAGDLNETIGDNGGGLTWLCSDCGLKDPVFEPNPH